MLYLIQDMQFIVYILSKVSLWLCAMINNSLQHNGINIYLASYADYSNKVAIYRIISTAAGFINAGN